MPRRKATDTIELKPAFAGAHTAAATGKPAPKPKRRVGWTIAFWVSLAVFLTAAFFVGRIFFSYWQGDAEYKDLAQSVLELPTEESIVVLSDLTVDWDALMAVNTDTIAWMYMPGTVINYPVVWCGNDETYLRRTFGGAYGNSVDFGTLFLEGANNPDFTDAHNIIFGHAMKNGTMFGALYRMSWNDTFNKYRDIYLLTPQGNLHLRTFAYVWVEAAEISVLTTNFATEEDRVAFLRDKMARTRFTPDDAIPNVTDMDRTFAFITCDSAAGTGRYVVYAYIMESTIEGIEPVGQLDPNSLSGMPPSLVEGLGW